METDEELVRRAEGGEVSAFECLLARYERSVLSVARSVLADVHLAEECIQEAFIAAWSSIATLKESSKCGPWLMLIAKRKAIRIASSERQHLSVSAPDQSTPAFRSDRSEHIAELLEMLGKLPDDERLLLSMQYFDGRSAREISTITGRPVGTVTKLMSRAYEKLRNMPLSTLEIQNEK